MIAFCNSVSFTLIFLLLYSNMIGHLRKETILVQYVAPCVQQGAQMLRWQGINFFVPLQAVSLMVFKTYSAYFICYVSPVLLEAWSLFMSLCEFYKLFGIILLYFYSVSVSCFCVFMLTCCKKNFLLWDKIWTEFREQIPLVVFKKSDMHNDCTAGC